MGFITRTVADLQELPETEPISNYYEFGLARCTKTCADSCGFTCGSGSCGHTVGVVAQGGGVTAEAVQKAQAEGAKWD
jgi:hypothetical protein